MIEPTHPAWIKAAPEPKRTIYKIRFELLEIDRCKEASRQSIGWSGERQSDAENRSWVRRAIAANHRVLALKRQLRAMKGE